MSARECHVARLSVASSTPALVYFGEDALEVTNLSVMGEEVAEASGLFAILFLATRLEAAATLPMSCGV